MTKTYDHASEAAARADALAAAKSELTLARQGHEEAQTADAERAFPHQAAWRKSKDRVEFAAARVERAEKGVRAAERSLLNTDTELAEAMAYALREAVYGLPISVQAHDKLDLPERLDRPLIVISRPRARSSTRARARPGSWWR